MDIRGDCLDPQGGWKIISGGGGGGDCRNLQGVPSYIGEIQSG